MPDFNSISIGFSELLDQMRKNESYCTKLSLGSLHPIIINFEDMQNLCSAITKNDTLTYLDFGTTVLEESLVSLLISALNKNLKITMLDYEKDHLPRILIAQIQEILERNRELTLTKKISPRVINFVLPADKVVAKAFQAVEDGAINLLYTLLLKEPNLLKQYNLNRSLLSLATERGQVDCVKLLLQFGADVIAVCESTDYSALYRAVSGNQIIISQLLLNSGASLEPKGAYKRTPMQAVRNIEVAKLLIKYKADITNDYELLPKVLNNNYPRLDLLQFLISKGAPIDSKGIVPNNDSIMHCLVRSIEEHTLIERQNLLMWAGANPLIKDTNGRTALDFMKLLFADPVCRNGLPARGMHIMESASNSYQNIRTVSRTMGQARRSRSSFFSRLPTEILAHIVTFTTGDCEYLEENTKNAIAFNHFGKP